MKTYGLMGYPLGHSFSRKFFTEKFKKENKPEEYLNFEIPEVGCFREILSGNPGLCGLNVTIPYKTQIIPFLDELDATAAAIGAVNTIQIARSAGGNVHLKGYNTDVHGFRESLKPMLLPYHDKALVLGTGGASRAVMFVLRALGISALRVSRNASAEETVTYSQLTRELMQSHTIIINTTPLGTYPDTASCPDIPFEFITPRHILYDLVYNPPVTEFLRKGLQKGASIKNGFEMLELQALNSYDIWNQGTRP